MDARRSAVLLILLLLVAACGEADKKSPPPATAAAPPPAEVDVITVEPVSATLTQDLPGRLSAIRSAQVRARVEGVIEKRLFTEPTRPTSPRPKPTSPWPRPTSSATSRC
jgi:membrane fusion protein, multidrug efflux system